ncbi:hypothetical protein AB6A40_003950 [Gnathostoma spinigerum]|uniref:Uncharacterized protein n=1 Tax=Gnathostoma spinigerum TaxID=75299 RepID=A0ABD6EC61_9BILA
MIFSSAPTSTDLVDISDRRPNEMEVYGEKACCEVLLDEMDSYGLVSAVHDYGKTMNERAVNTLPAVAHRRLPGSVVPYDYEDDLSIVSDTFIYRTEDFHYIDESTTSNNGWCLLHDIALNELP